MSNQVKLNLQQYIRVTAKSQVFVKDSTGMRGKTTAVFWKENETKKQEVYQHFKTAYISVAVGKTHTYTHIHTHTQNLVCRSTEGVSQTSKRSFPQEGVGSLNSGKNNGPLTSAVPPLC